MYSRKAACALPMYAEVDCYDGCINGINVILNFSQQFEGLNNRSLQERKISRIDCYDKFASFSNNSPLFDSYFCIPFLFCFLNSVIVIDNAGLLDRSFGLCVIPKTIDESYEKTPV